MWGGGWRAPHLVLGKGGGDQLAVHRAVALDGQPAEQPVHHLRRAGVGPAPPLVGVHGAGQLPNNGVSDPPHQAAAGRKLYLNYIVYYILYYSYYCDLYYILRINYNI